ncbi:MAG: gamma-glutamyl-phosphate reductase, partial [Alphaproteobacteria bacterium]
MSDTLVESDLNKVMAEIGQAAKAAARVLAGADGETKNRALGAAAAAIRARRAEIRTANAEDMALGREKGLSAPLMDRLELTDARIEAMATGL